MAKNKFRGKHKGLPTYVVRELDN